MTEKEYEELEKRIEERKKLRRWKQDLDESKAYSRAANAGGSHWQGGGSTDYYNAPRYQGP